MIFVFRNHTGALLEYFRYAVTFSLRSNHATSERAALDTFTADQLARIAAAWHLGDDVEGHLWKV